jgi:excisionase family DNA binding protein
MHAMSALEEDYLTVTEAAALLRVAPSTIRRWIREGDLPAYRLGRRRVGLRRHDLARLIKPVRPDEALGQGAGEVDDLKHITRRERTSEDIERALAAMDRAERHAKELLAARGGELFSNSTDIIHEMREERTRELVEAMGWDDLR